MKGHPPKQYIQVCLQVTIQVTILVKGNGRFTRSSIRKFNILPRVTPRAIELLKIGLFKFDPLGAKKPFKCPPISTEIPLLEDRFRLQSNT